MYMYIETLIFIIQIDFFSNTHKVSLSSYIHTHIFFVLSVHYIILAIVYELRMQQKCFLVFQILEAKYRIDIINF